MNKRVVSYFMSLIAIVSICATGCSNADCAREGMAVYTLGWEGGNWVSTCEGGSWYDKAVDEDSADLFFLKAFSGCAAVACYENFNRNCECINVYPYRNEN